MSFSRTMMMLKPVIKKWHKMNRKTLLIPAALAIFTIIGYYFFELDSSFSARKFQNVENQSSINCLQKIVDRTRKCLSDDLSSKNPAQIWQSLNPIIDKCTNFLQKTSAYIKIENTEDFKFIILPNNVPDDMKIKNQECTLLTLGIGGDIEAEKKVKNYFPNCTFVGADPSYESGKIFQEIGQFYNFAVTDKNGTVSSQVLENNNYTNKQVPSIDFYSMLQYANTTNIDFFFLDIEGGEYSIIPLLSKKYLKNYQLCQLSMEIHGFGDGEYGMTHEKFTKQIFNLLNESNYLPIFGQYVKNGGFNRMFWVDYESKFCVEKYIYDFCMYASA